MSTEPNDSSLASAGADALCEFTWTPQPVAGAWVAEIAAATLRDLPWAAGFDRQLAENAAVRFADLIDVVVPFAG